MVQFDSHGDDNEWLDGDDVSPLELRKRAANVLQAAFMTLSNGELPDELHERLNTLFAAVAQCSTLTAAWARKQVSGGQPEEVVADAANRAINSLTQAATCVAIAFVEDSAVGSAPKFSDN